MQEEQLRQLRTVVSRLKDKLSNKTSLVGQPDFVKYKDPCSMQPYDNEGLLEELRQLKRENTELKEDKQLLKVAADKYENRAIYLRKKYQQLVEKASLGSESSSNAPPDRARLQSSLLKK